jgi:energy-converting hydrogenase Eha subunit C
LLADVPKLGLGLAALGRPGYINLGRAADLGAAGTRSEPAMQAAAFAVLDAAWVSGVRYFDVAHGSVCDAAAGVLVVFAYWVCDGVCGANSLALGWRQG